MIHAKTLRKTILDEIEPQLDAFRAAHKRTGHTGGKIGKTEEPQSKNPPAYFLAGLLVSRLKTGAAWFGKGQRGLYS